MAKNEFYFNIKPQTDNKRESTPATKLTHLLFSAVLLCCWLYSASVVIPGMLAQYKAETTTILLGVATFMTGGLALLLSSMGLLPAKSEVSE